MAKKSSAILFDSREVAELVFKILSRDRYGLSADKIRKDLPPSHRIAKDRLAALLNDLVSEGRVYRWHPPKENAENPSHPIYSLQPLEVLVQGKILERLKDQPLPPVQIKKSFPASVGKYLTGFLEPLVRARKVKWHPPLKGKRLGLEEPDPADFLGGEIRRLLEKGKKLGFSAEAVMQAVQESLEPGSSGPPRLSGEETEKILFQAMARLKPAAGRGALVYIPDLRQAVRESFPNKESFDQALLNLAELEKVQLQSHSLPAELTQEQRQAMIDNGRGSYFMAVGIRME
jgi:hypothetical protein